MAGVYGYHDGYTNSIKTSFPNQVDNYQLHMVTLYHGVQNTYILSAWGELSRQGGWDIIHRVPVEQTE